jgi:Ni/Fe-hydrogenase subunit HybB-like protein
MSHVIAKPIKNVKFFTPATIVLTVIAVIGMFFLGVRFIYGIGYVSNLDDLFPWGIWNAINKAGGVALAAGGFISAAIGHIMHREHYNIVVRPALLTAMLGYTFVGFAVFFDIGRWYYIWHPIIHWNPNSALFEVGICVMIYLTVLYIEFIPIITEKFKNNVNMKGIFKPFNNITNRLLISLDNGLEKTMFIFIIAGVVLSSLHQSSLGTLMIIAGDKMHPLWQTPVLPLLFLISAVVVGIPMIILVSILNSKSFKLKPKMPILSRMSSYVGPLLGVYLSFKIGDIVIREAFVYLGEFSLQSVMFYVEVLIGIVVPLVMFLNKKVLSSVNLLLTACGFVIFGVVVNRINNFLVAYHPPYADYLYFPTIQEILVTLGCASVIILLYRYVVMNFPVISHDQGTEDKIVVIGEEKK